MFKNKLLLLPLSTLLILTMFSGCDSGDNSSLQVIQHTEQTTFTRQPTAWEAVSGSASSDTVADSANSHSTETVTETPSTTITTGALLSSTDDIQLHDTDGAGTNYEFTYNDEVFQAVYTPDNWKIIDSYKIVNTHDITVICEALTSIYPIHTADGSGYRDAADLAYEWREHNAAYQLLPEDSQWKDSTKDVDLDPKDQGKNMFDMAQDRLNNNNNKEQSDE